MLGGGYKYQELKVKHLPLELALHMKIEHSLYPNIQNDSLLYQPIRAPKMREISQKKLSNLYVLHFFCQNYGKTLVNYSTVLILSLCKVREKSKKHRNRERLKDKGVISSINIQYV